MSIEIKNSPDLEELGLKPIETLNIADDKEVQSQDRQREVRRDQVAVVRRVAGDREIRDIDLLVGINIFKSDIAVLF